MTATIPAIGRIGVADVPEIMPIERASYAAPWSPSMFVLELGRPNSLSIGARVDGQLVGYLVCSPQGHEWHVMNVTVAPAHRRRGYARRLLEAVHDLAAERMGGAALTTLEVRPSNEGAMRLYASLGYLVAGRRRRYYPDNGEDALVMWRTPGTLAGRLDDVPMPDHREARRWNQRLR